MRCCEKCGNSNSSSAKFCKTCGEKVPSMVDTAAPCVTCAAALPSGAKFCKQCGTAVASAPPPAPSPSPPAEPPVVVALVAAPPARVWLSAPSMAAALGAVAAIAACGFYLYQRSAVPSPAADSSAPVVAEASSPATTPVAAPAPVEKLAPVSVVGPGPGPGPTPQLAPAPPVAVASTPVPSEPIKRATPVAAQAPHRAAPVVAQVTGVVEAGISETLARKVSTLLSKANGYVENKQYDKAIATAENVLELDPNSSAAHAMINKAKTRQLDALRSGSTLE